MKLKHIHYEVIDSTQKKAWQLYELNKDKFIISASVQTDAIGTHGRKWYTEEDNNIAFSILIRPNCFIDKFNNLTIKVGLIIRDILNNVYGCKLSIKEPNDLMYRGKKIGGILLQTRVEENIVKAFVIGIGINTNQEIFNDDIKDIASSIKNEFNIFVDAMEFINIFKSEFLKELESRGII